MLDIECAEGSQLPYSGYIEVNINTPAMTVFGGIVILLSSAFLTKASRFLFFLGSFSCSAMHLKVRYQGVVRSAFCRYYHDYTNST
jgi:hypothetical protein